MGPQEKIHVLHVTFDMAIGGTEQVIRQLVSNVDPEKFFVSVLCLDGRVGEIGSIIQEQGIPVFVLNRRPGFDKRLILDIRKLVRDKSVDIIHCHQYTPYVYGWFGSLFTPAKVIFTEHGRFYPDTYHLKRLAVNPFMSLFTQEITAISNATRLALARFDFFPAHKIKVVYNGLASEEVSEDQAGLRRSLGIEDDEQVVGTVSRLDSIKNQKMMIEAFHQLLGQSEKIKLLIVGDGPERKSLESLVSQLGIENSVIFTGFQKYPLSYMSIMHVFLLSSFSEGTSMTLLEAMSLSIPCVVTDVGGNPEIILDHDTGLVVPNDDADAFCQAMLTLLSNPELYSGCSERSLLRYQQNFTVEKMISAYSELYDK